MSPSWSFVETIPQRDGVYVCLTNYDDVFSLAYKDGEWEKPHRFNKGERVKWWIAKPEDP